MRVGVVTFSVSRMAGGMFESVRSLHQALSQHTTTEVFSISDAHTSEDVNVWEPLPVRICDSTFPHSLRYSPKLSGDLAEFMPDVVHVHGLWQGPSIAALKWHKSTSQPYIVSPRGMLDPWALNHSRWKKRIAGFAFENCHLRSAKCIHALCESEAQSIRRYGLTNPIAVIPNGVHLRCGDEKARHGTTVRRQSDGRRKLLFLGRIHPKKGIKELLKAWSTIPATLRSDWSLLVAGWDDGGYLPELLNQVQQLRIEKSVQFVGPKYGDSKSAIFEAADAFILPSFSEGLPMAVLEAWSFGLPVVMTSHCNLPEGFTNGAAFEIVNSNNREMTNGLESFLKLSDSQLNAMGDAGRRLVESKFTWESISDAFVEVYKWIAGEGERPSCVR
ncbi:MAG TPA: glycosyl transferase family 1 [Planctomycetaceae bacterium]|nr:glycosyl transferase family 1 [Planctomycetaceae bacterium]